ncbi:MAG TPA: hypothetical protein VI278_07470 [Nitrososphaeraceae archaeon]
MCQCSQGFSDKEGGYYIPAALYGQPVENKTFTLFFIRRRTKGRVAHK